jgi:hypothetical protein
MDLHILLSPSPLTMSCSCGSPDFTVTSFVLSPATPHTDGSGNTSFRMGATIRTSGNTAVYGNGAYSGLLSISINY